MEDLDLKSWWTKTGRPILISTLGDLAKKWISG